MSGKLLDLRPAPLMGNKLVRLVYLDESGISAREPILVQAGIIIDADRQLVAVEDYLDEIIREYIPVDRQADFVFHATDIYGGGKVGSVFRDWPKEKRLDLLDALLGIPKKFNLPTVCSIINKKDFREHVERHVTRKPKDLEILVSVHAHAIMACEVAIELWMRDNAPQEITQVFAENNNDVREASKELHLLIRNESKLRNEGIINSAVFPFVKIRNGLYFATKSEAKILQVADACAWVIRRFAGVMDDSTRLFKNIEGQIIQFSDAALDRLEPEAF